MIYQKEIKEYSCFVIVANYILSVKSRSKYETIPVQCVQGVHFMESVLKKNCIRIASLDKNRPITRLLKTQVYIFLFLIQILHCYYFPLKNERLFPFNIKGNINQLGIHNLFYLTLQLHSELEIEKKHAVVCKPTQMLKKCKIDFCELFFLILLSERNRNIQ